MTIDELPEGYQLDPLTVAFDALVSQVAEMLPEERKSEVEPFKSILSEFIVKFIEKSTAMNASGLTVIWNRTDARLDDHEQRIEKLEQRDDG